MPGRHVQTWSPVLIGSSFQSAPPAGGCPGRRNSAWTSVKVAVVSIRPPAGMPGETSLFRRAQSAPDCFQSAPGWDAGGDSTNDPGTQIHAPFHPPPAGCGGDPLCSPDRFMQGIWVQSAPAGDAGETQFGPATDPVDLFQSAPGWNAGGRRPDRDQPVAASLRFNPPPAGRAGGDLQFFQPKPLRSPLFQSAPAADAGGDGETAQEQRRLHAGFQSFPGWRYRGRPRPLAAGTTSRESFNPPRLGDAGGDIQRCQNLHIDEVRCSNPLRLDAGETRTLMSLTCGGPMPVSIRPGWIPGETNDLIARNL